MDYVHAPIMITTLNRITHLRRCIESLERCAGADQTEIYVSIDYPPSDKYWDGYQDVVDYLEMKKNHNGFKEMFVYKQTENLGPSGNSDFLLKTIRKTSETYIATEDDNEFAPNFLEYINKGLEIFKNDERVAAICGCKEAEWETNGNTFVALQMYPPYGIGNWFHKIDVFTTECRRKLLNPQLIGESEYRRLKREDRTLFNHYILNVLLSDNPPFWYGGNLRMIDTVKTIYMHLSDRFSIVPDVCKSRTWGNDGSGVNMKKDPSLNPMKKWILDTEDAFDYILNGRIIDSNSSYEVDELIPFERNHKLESEYMKSARGIKANIKAEIGFIILKLIKFDYKKARTIIGKIKSII